MKSTEETDLDDTAEMTEENIEATETVTVVAYDDAQMLAHLQRIDTSLYMILLLACCFVIWTVVKYVYKLFSLFFSF